MIAPTLRPIGSSVFIVYPASESCAGLSLEFSHLVDHKETLTAELSITSLGAGAIYWGRVNLVSGQTRALVAKACDEVSPEAPWRHVLDESCRLVAAHLRTGEPAERLVPEAPTGHRYLVDGYLPLSQISILYADGGCLAGDTILETPGGAVRVEHALGVQRVWALSPTGQPVATWAHVSVKGFADLWRFTLQDGTTITVTGAHRFLTSRGWTRADACGVGERLAGCARAQLASTGGTAPSAWRPDALRSRGTDAGWRDHYSVDRRRCDRRLPAESGTGRAGARQSAGVPARSLRRSSGDAPELSEGDNRPDRASFHRTKSDYVLAAPWLGAEECRADASPSTPHPENIPVFRPFPKGWPGPQPVDESTQSEAEAGGDLFSRPGVYHRTITAIAKWPAGPYYDLQVPGYENYLAGGLWHHNSGKSLLALAIAAAGILGHALSPRWRVGPVRRALYLDWESDRQTHAERLWGLTSHREAPPADAILYRRLWRPLTDHLDAIRADAARHEADLVIVDSLAPACGPEPESGDASVRTLSALGALLPATILVVAHVSKTSGDGGGRTRIYGSVFNTNLARSTVEVKLDEARSADHRLAMSLRHDKSNLGPKVKPSALTFEWDEAGHILVSGGEVSSSIKSLPDRIADAIRGGRRSAHDIAEEVGRPVNEIRARLADSRGARWDSFAEPDTNGHRAKVLWGLVERQRTE